MSECPHCRYNTCRHECEECLKSELSLLRSKVERYEKALKLISKHQADSELDGRLVGIAKAALSDVGSEGEKA